MRHTVREAGRATIQLARAAALAFATVLFITVLLLSLVGAATVVGIVLLPETVLLLRRIASAKRRMTASWTGEPIPQSYLPIEPPLRDSVRAAMRDPSTYTDLRWMLAHYCYGWLLLLTPPLWAAGLLVDGARRTLHRPAMVLPLIGRLADLDAAWSTALLRPPPRTLMAARVRQLTDTRAEAIAAHGAELRRIERDLHDGAQARLVALSLRIGMARRIAASDPAAATALLDHAQHQAEQALAELRHVVRGIHPPILTDRGLSGALRALAAGNPVPVTVDTDGVTEQTRAPAAVEAAAYFVAAEALTNAAKHSGCDGAAILLTRTPAGLHLTITDDGRGGADPSAGSGLPGMRRRVAALDGTLTVHSPAGGPTRIEAELPCAW